MSSLPNYEVVSMYIDSSKPSIFTKDFIHPCLGVDFPSFLFVLLHFFSPFSQQYSTMYKASQQEQLKHSVKHHMALVTMIMFISTLNNCNCGQHVVLFYFKLWLDGNHVTSKTFFSLGQFQLDLFKILSLFFLLFCFLYLQSSVLYL